MPLGHSSKVSTLEEIDDTALIQLVYVSSLTLIGRLNTALFEEVERHARAYNQQQGITGILCYGNGQFLQCIEGQKAPILALQQRIVADKRHKNVKILLLQAIDERRFVDWRMRLLFLERWLWSPATKQQASQLSPYLPFAPHGWSAERTEAFLAIIQDFDSPPHIKAAGITYNALGNMFRYIAAPHQAFLLVQGCLTILVVLAIALLFW